MNTVVVQGSVGFDSKPRLDVGEVGLWWAEVPDDAKGEKRWMAMLAPEDLAHLGVFRRDQDRRRFLLRRALPRLILGRLLGRNPASLELFRKQGRAPCLGGQDSWLRFSISASGRIAVVAASIQEPLGVDIECVREDFDYSGVVSRFFSPEEKKLVSSLGRAAFFSIWVQKEARLKALGLGLSGLENNMKASAWPMDEIDVQPGYKTALCCRALEKITTFYEQ